MEEGVSTKEGISLKARCHVVRMVRAGRVPVADAFDAQWQVVGRVEDLDKHEVPESFKRSSFQALETFEHNGAHTSATNVLSYCMLLWMWFHLWKPRASLNQLVALLWSTYLNRSTSTSLDTNAVLPVCMCLCPLPSHITEFI